MGYIMALQSEVDTESAALRVGEYVAVRRFTRLLERGPEAKAALDQVIDRAGALVNLRTAISRYRKPRRRFRFFRCLPHISSTIASQFCSCTLAGDARAEAGSVQGVALRDWGRALVAGQKSRRGTQPSSVAALTWSATAC